MKSFLALVAFVMMSVPAAAQTCDPNGDYVCSDGCRDGFKGKQARVAVSGNSVILINEWGNSANGTISGRHITIPAWNATAIVSPSCDRLTFSVNATIWTR